MSFRSASRLEQVEPGLWRGEIQSDWDILGNANGGYLLAIAARARVLASGRRDPVTVTGHFLRPVRPGPIMVDTEVVKAGRRFATVRSSMRSVDGERLLEVLGSYGDLDLVDAPERVDAIPPDLPPVDDCIPVEPTETFPPPFMAQVSMRLHPEDAGFAMGAKSGIPRIRRWFKWRSGEALDTLGMIVAADAFPPTIFNADLPVAWAPTLELTTHLRERPRPDSWLRCAFTTRFITNGYMEEDGELWDEADRLIAQSRQLALLPRG
ncbi:MAG: thioesterase family protein [Acidimicrobiia bacterium]|nr:thioesterase family protein [Acidimicrobiia bacterium]